MIDEERGPSLIFAAHLALSHTGKVDTVLAVRDLRVQLGSWTIEQRQ